MNSRKWCRGQLFGLTMLMLGLCGCELDSFIDPTVVGRWESTPVVLPILDTLDVIDEPPVKLLGLSQVQPEDLVPEVMEYVIGPNDILAVSVFELLGPGQESRQSRQVDELGMFRHPMLGSIKVDGLTTSQLEKAVARLVEAKNLLVEPIVSVLVLQGRQNIFKVISVGGSGGIFQILNADFRILDAVALSRAVPFGTKKLYVYRQVALDDQVSGEAARAAAVEEEAQEPGAPADIGAVLEDIFNLGPDTGKGDTSPQPSSEAEGTTPPMPLEVSLDNAAGAGRWVNVDGQWVQVDQSGAQPVAEVDQGEVLTQPMIAQRIIEIPFDKLVEGDMSYNIVIRPGDTVRVPAPLVGNLYLGGAISRRGTFALPRDPVTLKQMVFAAGGFSALGIPGRVDLIRRIGADHEAFVRVNVRAIFEGRQPDIFLKPSDTLNFGTNFLATPLAVFRNGFRATYGFGFVLDRNFAFDVFGQTQRR